MDIRTVMTGRVQTITPETTIAEAQAIMRRGRFRHLPVVDGDTLAGIISERDLHGSSGRYEGADPDQQLVRAVMTRGVLTISPDDPLDQAARLMLENKVSCLPVMDEQTLAGILTQTDIYRAFIETMGVLEPGTRIQIYAPDLTDALAGIVRVAGERNVRVVTIHSEPGRQPGEVGLVVRFGTVMLAGLVQSLRAAGLDVVGPDPTTPGSAV